MTATTEAAVSLVYTPPTGSRTIGRVHRSTCAHIPKGTTPIPAERIDPDALYDATRATCCSPRAFDIRTAIAGHAPTTTKGTTMTATTAPETTDATTTTPEPATKPKATKAKAKATKKAAAPKTPRTKIGTFEVGDLTEFKCEGACGQTLPVKKFPTAGEGKRAVECRPDRDVRTAAEKAARDAAKGK